MEKDSKLVKYISTDIFVHQFLRLFRRLESMKVMPNKYISVLLITLVVIKKKK